MSELLLYVRELDEGAMRVTPDGVSTWRGIQGGKHVTPSDNVYRGTSLIRNNPPLGPYGRPMPRALWRSSREVGVS